MRGSAGIISAIQAFKPPMEYLSGTGGRSYMGDCAGVHRRRHPGHLVAAQARTGDSILSVLFDHEDPLAVVARRARADRHAAESNNEQVVVVGLGYVGLPLAVRAAEVGHQVVGVDLDPGKIERSQELHQLRRGRLGRTARRRSPRLGTALGCAAGRRDDPCGPHSTSPSSRCPRR